MFVKDGILYGIGKGNCPPPSFSDESLRDLKINAASIAAIQKGSWQKVTSQFYHQLDPRSIAAPGELITYTEAFKRMIGIGNDTGIDCPEGIYNVAPKELLSRFRENQDNREYLYRWAITDNVELESAPISKVNAEPILTAIAAILYFGTLLLAGICLVVLAATAVKPTLIVLGALGAAACLALILYPLYVWSQATPSKMQELNS
jgi:hypothetical protein